MEKKVHRLNVLVNVSYFPSIVRIERERERERDVYIK